jgi:hypothetical protein
LLDVNEHTEGVLSKAASRSFVFNAEHENLLAAMAIPGFRARLGRWRALLLTSGQLSNGTLTMPE